METIITFGELQSMLAASLACPVQMPYVNGVNHDGCCQEVDRHEEDHRQEARREEVAQGEGFDEGEEGLTSAFACDVRQRTFASQIASGGRRTENSVRRPQCGLLGPPLMPLLHTSLKSQQRSTSSCSARVSGFERPRWG